MFTTDGPVPPAPGEVLLHGPPQGPAKPPPGGQYGLLLAAVLSELARLPLPNLVALTCLLVAAVVFVIVLRGGQGRSDFRHVI
jgi:hypothetical protein